MVDIIEEIMIQKVKITEKINHRGREVLREALKREVLEEVLNEAQRGDLREALKEALEHYDNIENQDELMTKSDIARHLGISVNNLSQGAVQAYYVPFDKPMIVTAKGKKGWTRKVVMEHLARRDKVIKESYQEWLKTNKE